MRISCVAGIDFAQSGDATDLLARQLERPALLASALALASAGADLVLLTSQDKGLAAATAACCAIPVILPPRDAEGRPTPDALATLFTAGAIDRLSSFEPVAPAAEPTHQRAVTCPRDQLARPAGSGHPGPQG